MLDKEVVAEKLVGHMDESELEEVFNLGIGGYLFEDDELDGVIAKAAIKELGNKGIVGFRVVFVDQDGEPIHPDPKAPGIVTPGSHPEAVATQ